MVNIDPGVGVEVDGTIQGLDKCTSNYYHLLSCRCMGVKNSMKGLKV